MAEKPVASNSLSGDAFDVIDRGHGMGIGRLAVMAEEIMAT
ncbi:MAG: hypothetical protein ABIP32_09740 [Chthoniobacterales bacterium]